MHKPRNKNPLSGPIPESIPLNKAPLIGVLFQIQFPKIDKIQKEKFIRGFQESIRPLYPQIDNTLIQGIEVRIHKNEASSLPVKEKFWHFSNQNDNYRIGLGSGSLSIQTDNYISRKELLARFKVIIENFNEFIKPTSVERLGVRYMNQITNPSLLSKLDMLIRSEFLTVNHKDLYKKVDYGITEINGKTKEGKIKVRHGMLPPRSNYPFHMFKPINKSCWILDIDSINDSIIKEFNSDELVNKFEKLASRAYAFFRWFVKDEFLKQFGGMSS